jgi:hypothetical protein
LLREPHLPDAPARLFQAWAARPPEYIEQLKVGHNADGGLEVFASTHPFNGAPHRLFHIGQREDGGWDSWQYLGENAGGHFAIASEADFRLRVFLNGTPVVRTIAQVTPSGAWGPWEDTAMPTANLADGVRRLDGSVPAGRAVGVADRPDGHAPAGRTDRCHGPREHRQLRGATGPLAAGPDTANRQWLFSSSTDRLVYRASTSPVAGEHRRAPPVGGAPVLPASRALRQRVC